LGNVHEVFSLIIKEKGEDKRDKTKSYPITSKYYLLTADTIISVHTVCLYIRKNPGHGQENIPLPFTHSHTPLQQVRDQTGATMFLSEIWNVHKWRR
jgi:hypothetical protein